MKKSYIVYAKRTPIGKLGGALSHVRVDDMLAHLFKDIKEWATFDLEEVDDVIAGCANQAGEDNRNLARMASTLAEFPFEVPATTINRLCGSSLDAAMDAVGRISAGFGDCFVIGGAESMTRAPLVISKGSTPFGRDSKMYDTTFGWRFPNPKMKELFPLLGMGETAEVVAEQYSISREDQDKFALASHQKAHAAWEEGRFNDEVLPIEVKLRKSSHTVSRDEGPRPDTNLEVLGKLRTVFKDGGSVTAGNASQMNDGASAVVIVSEDFLKKHNLTPLAEVTGAAVRGVHPNVMGLGPIEAVKKLCKDFDKKVEDFDVFELNEAFAAQSLACIRELGIDEEKVNLNGGAISLGHPLGCSGARILTTLVHIMNKREDLKEGLATMCIGVGQGIALSIKKPE
ncbi:beta-ketoadipyl CoA thiolase [Halobacteriovorax marinus]|uniref:thiolase family protein n=1 Tax=Halobacteriovorax marinus TaxID=97084 RepID=UPI000BC3076C|nr:thiolase family protein [Halobacteriovorax marinus]ATH08155.1 beta-ketoadipyl CoA thiolase [Halobacteriovorax marinus]